MNKKNIFILFLICCLSAFAYGENQIVIRNVLTTDEYLEEEYRSVVDLEGGPHDIYTYFKMDEIKILPEEVVNYCAKTNDITKGICRHKDDFAFDYKRLEKLNGIYLEPQCSEDDFTLHKFKNGKLYSRIYELGCVVTGDDIKLIIEDYFMIEFNKQEYLVEVEEKLEFLKHYPEFLSERNEHDYMAKVKELNITINVDKFPEGVTDAIDKNGISQKENYCKEILDLLMEDYVYFSEYNSDFDFEIPMIYFRFKFKDDMGRKTMSVFCYTYAKGTSLYLEGIE